MKIIAMIATTTCNDNYKDNGNGRTGNNGRIEGKGNPFISFLH